MGLALLVPGVEGEGGPALLHVAGEKIPAVLPVLVQGQQEGEGLARPDLVQKLVNDLTGDLTAGIFPAGKVQIADGEGGRIHKNNSDLYYLMKICRRGLWQASTARSARTAMASV